MDEFREDLTQRKIYPSANECIYCGARDVPLTDEHTIPEGMGGRHILPHACCAVCQKIINEEFEQYCLRTLFSNVRAVFGIKSRKKRKRVRHSLKIRKRSGEIARVYRGVDELPCVFALPVFPEPFFMSGNPADGDIFEGAWWHFSEKPMKELLTELDAESIITDTIYPNKMARFLAKMARSHAWAIFGPVFEPFLPSIILGNNLRFIRYVGGRVANIEPEPGSPFRMFVMLIHEDEYLVAHIRLFGELGAPVYYAVIGKLLKPWPLQSRSD